MADKLVKSVTINGYTLANEVDAIINRALKQQPITAENAIQWMRFTRSVGTSLNIVNYEIKKVSGISPESELV